MRVSKRMRINHFSHVAKSYANCLRTVVVDLYICQLCARVYVHVFVLTVSGLRKCTWVADRIVCVCVCAPDCNSIRFAAVRRRHPKAGRFMCCLRMLPVSVAHRSQWHCIRKHVRFIQFMQRVMR